MARETQISFAPRQVIDNYRNQGPNPYDVGASVSDIENRPTYQNSIGDKMRVQPQPSPKSYDEYMASQAAMPSNEELYRNSLSGQFKEQNRNNIVDAMASAKLDPSQIDENTGNTLGFQEKIKAILEQGNKRFQEAKNPNLNTKFSEMAARRLENAPEWQKQNPLELGYSWDKDAITKGGMDADDLMSIQYMHPAMIEDLYNRGYLTAPYKQPQVVTPPASIPPTYSPEYSYAESEPSVALQPQVSQIALPPEPPVQGGGGGGDFTNPTNDFVEVPGTPYSRIKGAIGNALSTAGNRLFTSASGNNNVYDTYFKGRNG